MAEQNPLDIPLDLNTGWYTDVDAEDYEIPYLKANPTVAYVRNRVETARSGPSIAFIRVTFACLRYADLSRTFIQIQWTPTTQPTAKQKHFPPPVPVGAVELLQYSQRYGPKVVEFCQSQKQKVGDGECWTLAHDALEWVKTQVNPPCMVSFGLFHGQAIFSRKDKATVSGDLATVRPGDIIQYKVACFEEFEEGRHVRNITNGNPDHTSVIVLVTAPGVWTVLEQGTSLPNIQRKVVKVQEMVSGSLIVYRPVPETWLGSMEPVYD